MTNCLGMERVTGNDGKEMRYYVGAAGGRGREQGEVLRQACLYITPPAHRLLTRPGRGPAARDSHEAMK